MKVFVSSENQGLRGLSRARKVLDGVAYAANNGTDNADGEGTEESTVESAPEEQNIGDGPDAVEQPNVVELDEEQQQQQQPPPNVEQEPKEDPENREGGDVPDVAADSGTPQESPEPNGGLSNHGNSTESTFDQAFQEFQAQKKQADDSADAEVENSDGANETIDSTTTQEEGTTDKNENPDDTNTDPSDGEAKIGEQTESAREEGESPENGADNEDEDEGDDDGDDDDDEAENDDDGDEGDDEVDNDDDGDEGDDDDDDDGDDDDEDEDQGDDEVGDEGDNDNKVESGGDADEKEEETGEDGGNGNGNEEEAVGVGDGNGDGNEEEDVEDGTDETREEVNGNVEKSHDAGGGDDDDEDTKEVDYNGIQDITQPKETNPDYIVGDDEYGSNDILSSDLPMDFDPASIGQVQNSFDNQEEHYEALDQDRGGTSNIFTPKEIEKPTQWWDDDDDEAGINMSMVLAFGVGVLLLYLLWKRNSASNIPQPRRAGYRELPHGKKY